MSRTADEILFRALVPLVELGGLNRSGAGRGQPGYPVPPEMEPDSDRPELEEGESPLAKSPVPDDPSKDPNKGYSETHGGPPKRDHGREVYTEAGEEKKLPKGIQHLEELSPDEFLVWLRKYRALPIEGGLEVSEKVDGSARITFGVEDGRLWTQSKNGPRRYSADGYPDKPVFAALRAAHHALASRETQIRKWWDVAGNDVVLGAEVLYTRVPNSIEYGPNALVIHSVLGPGGVQSAERSKEIATDLIRATGASLGDGKDPWRLEYKRVIDPKEVMVDTEEEFGSLEDIYRKLSAARTKGEEAGLKERFRAVQLALKKKLLGQLGKQRSGYGPEGGDMEGLVFRDLDSGALAKLVDRDYFSALNRFMWFYRELLSRGVKTGERWVPGIGRRLMNYLSDEVLGTTATKSPAFVSNLKKRYGTPKTSQELDGLLGKYIADSHLMQGDYLGRLHAVIEKTRRELGVVKNDWDEKKKGDIVFVSSDGRKRKMDDLIKRRTDDAFADMDETLNGLDRTRAVVAGITDEDTRRVALLKAILGDSRLEKLGGGNMKEAHTKDTPTKKRPANSATQRKKRIDAVQLVVRRNLKALARRGVLVNPNANLGHGSWGVAYEISYNGKRSVFKATSDEQEARASNHVKGKPTRHIVRIYDVFKFPKTGMYGIVEEKLQEPTGEEREEFDDLAVELVEAGAGNEIIAGDIAGIRKMVQARFTDSPVVAADFDEKIQKFQFGAIIKELHSFGIEFLDFHSGNVMKRGSDWVIIDLGLSQSPGGEPDVLERLVRGVVSSVSSEGSGMRGISGATRSMGLGPVPARKMDEDTYAQGPWKMGQPEHQDYVGVSPTVNHAEDGSLEKFAKDIEETVIDGIVESTVDTVGVTVGRYQPFHRGHAEVIRNLARSHTKVVVLVAGNTVDRKNPFSYETRVRMMKESLPDVWRKVEVYRATFGGKNSGYVPGILSDVIGKGSSAVKGDTAVEILVGPDRFEHMQQQLDRARKYKEDGGETKFDPDIAVVKRLAGVKNDDDADRVSGTRVRQALIADDKESLKKMLDPHLVSNNDQFEDTVVRLRNELEQTGPLHEDLSTLGGEPSVMAVLRMHAEKLKEKGIDIGRLRELGQGQAGVAYDMGGGKVLKVTTSVNEARSCVALKGKSLPHIVRIFDIFKMNDPKQTKVPVYGVIRENLQPLPANEKAELNDIVDLLRDEQVTGNSPTIVDFDQAVEKMRALMTRDVRRELDLPEKPPTDPQAVQNNKRELRARGLVEQKMTELVGRLRHYQIDKMMEELKSLNIMFADYKGDNIMKRGGDYVLADPGGKTAAAEPPVLEGIVEMIINEIGVTFTSTGPGGTQSGLRAGSSGWSSPQNMYTDEDVIAAQEGEEIEMWSDKLKNVHAVGEEIVRMLTRR